MMFICKQKMTSALPAATLYCTTTTFEAPLPKATPQSTTVMMTLTLAGTSSLHVNQTEFPLRLQTVWMSVAHNTLCGLKVYEYT